MSEEKKQPKRKCEDNKGNDAKRARPASFEFESSSAYSSSSTLFSVSSSSSGTDRKTDQAAQAFQRVSEYLESNRQTYEQGGGDPAEDNDMDVIQAQENMEVDNADADLLNNNVHYNLENKNNMYPDNQKMNKNKDPPCALV